MRTREKDGRHDNMFYTFDPFLRVSLFEEPFSRDTRTEIFILIVLLYESSIMEECCDLQIFECVTYDSFFFSEVLRSGVNSPCVGRIVVWIVRTVCLEEREDIVFCMGDKVHTKINYERHDILPYFLFSCKI